jgi:hypothetical protein
MQFGIVIGLSQRVAEMRGIIVYLWRLIMVKDSP